MSSTTDPGDDGFEALVRRAVRELPDAPLAWQQAAVGLWPGPLERAAAQLRRVLAVLSFDSAALSAPALGLRSAGAGARHLLFSAGAHDVDLRISVAGAGFDLAGQLLGPSAGGRVEALAEAGGAPLGADLDELGEFRLRGLAPGRYRLSFEVADEAIELPPLDLHRTGP